MPFHTFSLLLFFTLSPSLFFFLYTLIIVSKNLSFSLLLALQAFSASAASDRRPIVIDSSLGSTLYRTLHFQRSKMLAESRLVCVCVCVFHVFFLSCASLSLSSNCLARSRFPPSAPQAHSATATTNLKSKSKIRKQQEQQQSDCIGNWRTTNSFGIRTEDKKEKTTTTSKLTHKFKITKYSECSPRWTNVQGCRNLCLIVYLPYAPTFNCSLVHLIECLLYAEPYLNLTAIRIRIRSMKKMSSSGNGSGNIATATALQYEISLISFSFYPSRFPDPPPCSPNAHPLPALSCPCFSFLSLSLCLSLCLSPSLWHSWQDRREVPSSRLGEDGCACHLSHRRVPSPHGPGALRLLCRPAWPLCGPVAASQQHSAAEQREHQSVERPDIQQHRHRWHQHWLWTRVRCCRCRRQKQVEVGARRFVSQAATVAEIVSVQRSLWAQQERDREVPEWSVSVLQQVVPGGKYTIHWNDVVTEGVGCSC